MKENKVKKQRYEVIGTLNNNGVVAKDELNKEVILLGKGIGFKRKAGDVPPLIQKVLLQGLS